MAGTASTPPVVQRNPMRSLGVPDVERRPTEAPRAELDDAARGISERLNLDNTVSG
jgi:hypothetical protein